MFQHRFWEARNFVGRMGLHYCIHLATPEERMYWDGMLYDKGVPILSALYSLLSTPYCFA